MKRPIVSSIIAMLVAGMLVAVAAQVTWAATITVNTTADNVTGGDGQCTLREALANVNAAADTTGGDCTAGTGAGDTVAFDLTLPARTRSAKIKLTLGELVIQHDVAIIGPTAASLHVSGERASRIFLITAGVTASMSDLTMEAGATASLRRLYAAGNGGAILNLGGTLTLTNCTLANSRAFGGGGIASYIYYDYVGGRTIVPTAALVNCTLKNNWAVGGGAIVNGGTMTLVNCTLTGNVATDAYGGYATGGAINNAGTMTLTNCTLNGNRASHGGGIANYGGSPYNNGSMSLTNCTLTGNYGRWGAGGGIMNLSNALTLTNCTISGNKAYAGRNSLGGGGIWQYPADQDPDGVGAMAVVTNTIISGNRKGRYPADCGGDRPTSNGHNLDSDGTCFTDGGTDLVNTDPLLAPLANYGGPTKTLAACVGAGLPNRRCTGASPAIDAGDDAVSGPPLDLTTDQRGLPRLSGAHVDIGAYEAQQ